ncbi:MAG TPA: Gfo/Idh/MocA family oxidoreductase [Anaerolineae bacterium]|nr:Gfo/Idh/MocA family oxidoreductase [Anaerolineae bacterium]HQH38001.1 Gfo/Idh/MocA family oxidoreductase [Anaerolineae bacterium]
MHNPKILIIGAGSRGSGYATYFHEVPHRGQVIGVAEPRDTYRERLVTTHHIPAGNVFTDWKDAAERPRFADAVIIATQDRMHTEPAMAFAKLGYHVLLEKPLAPTAEECRAIVDTVKAAGVLFGVCHVMRYTRFTQRLKALIESGAIGDLVSIQHLEPVGFWHQAHSFVRGNWRHESESGPMLLTKSCHDIDWLRYVMGVSCEAVSSFGTLKHFRKEEQPTGASDRCLDCAVESNCPYSARRIYMTALERGYSGWPLDVLTPTVNRETVLEALRTGPYGRCVYACDNDVVDNQVVNLQFAGGRTASFTMMAFTRMRDRETHLFGTRGELTGDGRYIHHYDFMTDSTHTIDTEADAGPVLGGHGGGDYWLMHHFTQALIDEDPRHILSGPDETLESHLMVFAAEQARKEGRVVFL